MLTAQREKVTRLDAGPLCVGSTPFATATAAVRRAGRGHIQPVRQDPRSRRRAHVRRAASAGPHPAVPVNEESPPLLVPPCPSADSTHIASIPEPKGDRAASWIDGRMLNFAGHRSSQCLHSSHRLAASATVLHWSSAAGKSPCFAR